MLAATVCSPTRASGTPLPLVGLLALLVLGSDILVLDAKRFRIGGSFTGLVLAMALLGPAPAAVLGLACALVDALRRRVRGTYLLNNLLTYTTFPLIGGIALHAIHEADPEESGYAVAVFCVFIVTNALNFLMIAGHTRLLRGGSLPEMLRRVFIPVLPWEIATAVMTAMAVYGFEESRPRDHRPVRSGARRLPVAAAGAARGPDALGGDRAPDGPARRPP